MNSVNTRTSKSNTLERKKDNNDEHLFTVPELTMDDMLAMIQTPSSKSKISALQEDLSSDAEEEEMESVEERDDENPLGNGYRDGSTESLKEHPSFEIEERPHRDDRLSSNCYTEGSFESEYEGRSGSEEEDAPIQRTEFEKTLLGDEEEGPAHPEAYTDHSAMLPHCPKKGQQLESLSADELRSRVNGVEVFVRNS